MNYHSLYSDSLFHIWILFLTMETSNLLIINYFAFLYSVPQFHFRFLFLILEKRMRLLLCD